MRVHVNGLGDFDIASITVIEDPVPIELKKTVREKQAELAAGKKSKKRNLKDKERVLYAPYSNVGQLNLDRSEGYINIPDSNVVFTRIDEEPQTDLNEG